MIKLAVIDKNKRIEFLNELSPIELNVLLSHSGNLHRFDKSTEKFRIFKTSYLELMSAFRAIIDHWETELRRKFGKQSKEIEIFKQATNVEYDTLGVHKQSHGVT